MLRTTWGDLSRVAYVANKPVLVNLRVGRSVGGRPKRGPQGPPGTTAGMESPVVGLPSSALRPPPGGGRAGGGKAGPKTYTRLGDWGSSPVDSALNLTPLGDGLLGTRFDEERSETR